MKTGSLSGDIAIGAICLYCGCLFQEEDTEEFHEHGHPVVCWECWDKISIDEKNKYQRSLVPSF